MVEGNRSTRAGHCRGCTSAEDNSFWFSRTAEMKPDSDLDVLVVMPEGVHRRRTAQLLYRQIKGLRVSFDILVATPGAIWKNIKIISA